jgi:lysozyme
VQPRNPHNARGIDVSSNNGSIDFAKVKAAGYSFVLVKATEGATWNDPAFLANYRAAKAAGLIRGAYCFARPRTSSAVNEADAYVDTVFRAGGFDGLPPVLDMEDEGGLTASELAHWILAWEGRVRARTAKQPLIYASTAFLQEHLVPAARMITHIPLWVACYNGGRPPHDVGPWTHWTFYQWTETGAIPGHSGHVDFSEFAGTVEELRKFCGVGESDDQDHGSIGKAAVKQESARLNQHGKGV